MAVLNNFKGSVVSLAVTIHISFVLHLHNTANLIVKFPTIHTVGKCYMSFDLNVNHYHIYIVHTMYPYVCVYIRDVLT